MDNFTFQWISWWPNGPQMVKAADPVIPCFSMTFEQRRKSEHRMCWVVYLYAADNSYEASGPRLRATVSSPATGARPPGEAQAATVSCNRVDHTRHPADVARWDREPTRSAGRCPGP